MDLPCLSSSLLTLETLTEREIRRPHSKSLLSTMLFQLVFTLFCSFQTLLAFEVEFVDVWGDVVVNITESKHCS